MSAKDNFSLHSDKYAKYRPTYSSDFFGYMNALIPYPQNAWDCGTGNGQVAFELAKTFDKVFATDISQPQINNALPADNIFYSVQPAEKTNFSDAFFDLVVVAQAIHWFDFEKFYTEVRRTAKENALFCVMGYGRLKISAQIDAVITSFYTNVLGPYWDKERRYIDDNYTTIPFPFEEMATPVFETEYEWTFEHLMGYLNTWSAVKHFTQQNGFNPTEKIKSEIEKNWGPVPTKTVRFPMLLRMGRITNEK